MARRLTLVVEGHGEVEAFPRLCARVVYSRLGIPASSWFVDKDPIRIPRSLLVDARAPEGRRPPRDEGMTKLVGLARARPADAVLVVVDADNDCPVFWAPAVPPHLPATLPGAAVMAVREYEAWLLAGHAAVPVRTTADDIPNPKALATKTWPGYRPTTHQLALTNSCDLALAEQRSRSFRCLVAALRRLTEPPPEL